jgi:hypothetical protein
MGGQRVFRDACGRTYAAAWEISPADRGRHEPQLVGETFLGTNIIVQHLTDAVTDAWDRFGAGVVVGAVIQYCSNAVRGLRCICG